MSMTTFYRDQATEQQRNAAAATLDKVRIRSLRAASAWTTLADRAQRFASDKAAREARETGKALLDEPSENPDRGQPTPARLPPTRRRPIEPQCQQSLALPPE